MYNNLEENFQKTIRIFKMNKLYFYAVSMILILFTVTCSTPPLRRAKGTWSEFQGKYTWEQGANVCKGMGMRLPTLDELKHAYEAKLTKEWKTDGHYYWTETSAFGGGYFVFITHSGNVFYNYKNEDYYLVRCFRPEATEKAK
jgi:hypothetical protein